MYLFYNSYYSTRKRLWAMIGSFSPLYFYNRHKQKVLCKGISIPNCLRRAAFDFLAEKEKNLWYTNTLPEKGTSWTLKGITTHSGRKRYIWDIKRYSETFGSKKVQPWRKDTVRTIKGIFRTKKGTFYWSTLAVRPASVLAFIFSRRMETAVAIIPTPTCTAAKIGIGSRDATGWLTQVLATFTMRSDGRKMP